MRTILIIGYGNPGRRDDGLGPGLAERIERMGIPGVTVDSDYQLTVEDAEAVARHEVVIFADASVRGTEPFFFRRVAPRAAPGFSSHGVEPEEVLALAETLFGARPEAYVLGMRGCEFDVFGEGLSTRAAANLDQAVTFIARVLRGGECAAAECGTPGEPDCGARNVTVRQDTLEETMTMSQGKRVVLCVDDDQDFLDSMKTIIECNNYLVDTATSVEEGLRKYKADKPDLVIVDLMMEEVDSGISLVKAIQALGATPPLYMLSSVGDGLTLSTDYTQLGLAGVLQKPINPQILLATLEARLGK